MNWLILNARLAIAYLLHEYQPKVLSLYMYHTIIGINQNTYYKHSSVKITSQQHQAHSIYKYEEQILEETSSSQDIFENKVTNKTYLINKTISKTYE